MREKSEKKNVQKGAEKVQPSLNNDSTSISEGLSKILGSKLRRAAIVGALTTPTAFAACALTNEIGETSHENTNQVSQALWQNPANNPTFGQTGNNLSPFVYRNGANAYAVFTSDKSGGPNPWNIYCSKSSDGAQTWSAEVAVNSSLTSPGKEVNGVWNEFGAALHYTGANYDLYFTSERDGTADIWRSPNFDVVNCKAATDSIKLPVGGSNVNSNVYNEGYLTVSQGGNGNKLYFSTEASGLVFKIHVTDIGTWTKTLVSGIAITPAYSSTVWDNVGKTYIGLGVGSGCSNVSGSYDLCRFELTSPSTANGATVLNFNSIPGIMTAPNDAFAQDQPMVDAVGTLWYTNKNKVAKKDPIGGTGGAGGSGGAETGGAGGGGTGDAGGAETGAGGAGAGGSGGAETGAGGKGGAGGMGGVCCEGGAGSGGKGGAETGGTGPGGEGGADGGYECLAKVVENKSQCTITCPGGQIDIKVDGECKVDYKPLGQANPTKLSLKGQNKHLGINLDGTASSDQGLQWDVDENGGALQVHTVGVLAGPEGTQFGALYKQELNQDGQNNVITFYTTDGLINLSINGVPLKFTIEGYKQGQLPAGWEVNVNLKTQSVIGEPIKSGAGLPEVTPPEQPDCNCSVPGYASATKNAVSAALAGAIIAISLMIRRGKRAVSASRRG